jgi:hypothetical protein
MADEAQPLSATAPTSRRRSFFMADFLFLLLMIGTSSGAQG